jgi:predicted protein tyrosine phosphatase
MNILFVCSLGKNRSRTAAGCLKNGSNLTSFVGTDIESDVFIGDIDITSFDLVIFMEEFHFNATKNLFPKFSGEFEIWGIPDVFDYMDFTLITRLRSNYSKIDPFYI